MPKGVYKRTDEYKRMLKGGNSGSFKKGNKIGIKSYFKKGSKPKTGFKKGNTYGKGNLGNKLSEEHRRKISEEWRGKSLSGKNHWNWKGGITPENKKIRDSLEIKLWREAVFARDNFICLKCGDNKGGNLHAHHIQNFADYPELRTSIENGITFCKKCHTKFHKKYSCKNNTKEQIEEFLN